MAPDINLLPDEGRRAEERELRNPRGSSGEPVYSTPRSVAPAPAVAAPAAPVLPDVKPAPLPKPQPPAPAPEPKAPPVPFGSRLKALLSKIGKTAEPKVTPGAAPGVNLDVNLIPQETAAPSFSGLWPLVGAVLGAALVVAGSYVGLGLGVSANGRALAEAQAKSAAASQRLLGQQQVVEEMGRAVQQVRAVAGLLDRHVYWNRYFAWLESVTLPDVYYTGFMGDVAGTFTLNASARDYVTLAQQLVVLRADPRVVQVNVAEASRDSQGWVNFVMTLTVSPSIFTTES